MTSKKVIVSVTNDLTTDGRVAKICKTLREAGLEVMLVGVRRKGSAPIYRDYTTVRFNLLFNKGPLFYANYNLRLFFFLLFNRTDILWSNDLDTLLANFFIAKLKRSKLIFDSHEYFTEVPELVERPSVKSFWKTIERLILPRLKHVLTVSESIASLYRKEYDVKVSVLRNVPELFESDYPIPSLVKDNNKIIVYQGAVNRGRGIEPMVSAMRFIDDAIFYIIGKGDISESIERLIKSEGVESKVVMLGEVPYEQLHCYTKQANLGISLEQNDGLNYKYALPNKLFNYINQDVPVLVSNLPEMAALVNKYEVGDINRSNDPKQLAEKVNQMLSNQSMLDKWKKNCLKAKTDLNWNKEKQVVLSILENLR